MRVPQFMKHACHNRYVQSVRQVPGLSASEAARLVKIEDRYAFRANEYYLNLIDWDDPDDPIRRLIIPVVEEMSDWGQLDASDEAANTVLPGLQHKYRDTALVLAASTCAAHCRYCFRKRLFMAENHEVVHHLDQARAYVAAHPEISHVLLSGGDPLTLASDRLRHILAAFAAIPHVRTIRIGSKVFAFDPGRITTDLTLPEAIAETVAGGTSVYLVTHFDHPRELTPEARRAVAVMQNAGAHLVNQCPLVRGVNDDPAVLAELFATLSDLGAPQYYVYQLRPTAGNEPYKIPLVAAWRIFDAACRRVSGLARRARFCMSHSTGKIEIVGLDGRCIYCRYHRAPDLRQEGRVVVCRRDDAAHWFDDLVPADAFPRPS